MSDAEFERLTDEIIALRNAESREATDRMLEARRQENSEAEKGRRIEAALTRMRDRDRLLLHDGTDPEEVLGIEESDLCRKFIARVSRSGFERGTEAKMISRTSPPADKKRWQLYTEGRSVWKTRGFGIGCLEGQKGRPWDVYLCDDGKLRHFVTAGHPRVAAEPNEHPWNGANFNRALDLPIDANTGELGIPITGFGVQSPTGRFTEVNWALEEKGVDSPSMIYERVVVDMPLVEVLAEHVAALELNSVWYPTGRSRPT
jgi:hypothetical protein